MKEVKGYKSWTISDELWEEIKDEIPQRYRDKNKEYTINRDKEESQFLQEKC